MEQLSEGARHSEKVDQVRCEERTVQNDSRRCKGLSSKTGFDQSKCDSEYDKANEQGFGKEVVPTDIATSVEAREEEKNGKDEGGGAGKVDPPKFGFEVGIGA